MSLSIGIVGMPNVGKSTLFNALTNSEILSANYPFATIQPNTGIVPVPDERLDVLQKMYSSEKLIPATVTFVDIAGLVAGASKGEGLGNQFLANIRECDAIIHMVRAFDNSDILHVSENPSPKDDIEIINTELILADIQTLEKQAPKLQKESRQKPEAKVKLEILNHCLELLNSGKTLTEYKDSLDEDAQKNLKSLNLLTTKTVIYAFNLDENELTDETKKAALQKMIAPSESIFLCAKIEEELRGMNEKDKTEMLESYGVSQSGLDQLTYSAYKTLGLQSYLTAGPKEVRAWTIKQGATAPQAAGAIHTDFERGFIAASVVSYQDLVNSKTEAEAKAKGLVRTEGKDYIMKPDDVVEFRFNV